MKKYKSTQSIEVSSKTKKLMELRDKISKMQKPKNNEEQIELPELYLKIKNDEKTISKLFDAISEHYYKTQNRITQIAEKAQKKIQKIQDYLFKELDKVKNIQLDSIKEDIQSHLKYSKKVKRIMMTGISKNTKKLTQQFDIRDVVKKIQNIKPSCLKMEKSIDNFEKIIQGIIQIQQKNIHLGNVSFLSQSKSPSIQMYNVKSLASLASSFQEYSQYRKSPNKQERIIQKKVSQNEDFELLLPTANKNDEDQDEPEEISFPSKNYFEEKEKIQNSEDFSLNIKASQKNTNLDIKYYGSQGHFDSKELFERSKQIYEKSQSAQSGKNGSINNSRHSEMMGKNPRISKTSHRTTLMRVKSVEQLMNSKIGTLNAEQSGIKKMKSDYSLELNKSLMQSGINSRRSNPLESLKQQQLKYNELKKKIKK